MSSHVLKHVWLVGRLALSVPAFWMMKLILPKPPIGAFELAVANLSSFPRSSEFLSFTNFQKFLTTSVESSYPPSYLVFFSKASKSKSGMPMTNNSNSSGGWSLPQCASRQFGSGPTVFLRCQQVPNARTAAQILPCWLLSLILYSRHLV